MAKKLYSLWGRVLLAILGVLGLNGCLLRAFACAYGGPPDEYYPVEEVVEPAPEYEELPSEVTDISEN